MEMGDCFAIADRRFGRSSPDGRDKSLSEGCSLGFPEAAAPQVGCVRELEAVVVAAASEVTSGAAPKAVMGRVGTESIIGAQSACPRLYQRDLAKRFAANLSRFGA